MRKFLSIVGLTGVLLFAGNAAYAAPVEEPAVPVQVEGMMPTGTGKIIPLNSFDRDPVTNELDYRDTPPRFVDYPSTPVPAVVETPAAVAPAVAPMAIPAGPVQVVPPSVSAEVPVTGCGDVTESGVIVGNNAEGCQSFEDCPRGPSGECYSEAVPMPGYTEPVTAPAEPVAVPETVETTEIPAPTTEPVRAELADTGAGEAILAGAGVVFVLVGVTMVRYGIRKRRA